MNMLQVLNVLPLITTLITLILMLRPQPWLRKDDNLPLNKLALSRGIFTTFQVSYFQFSLIQGVEQVFNVQNIL